MKPPEIYHFIKEFMDENTIDFPNYVAHDPHVDIKLGGRLEMPTDTFKLLLDKFSEKHSLDFIDWLMTNCELSEDQTIWSYNSEDYSLEGIYEVFKNH